MKNKSIKINVIMNAMLTMSSFIFQIVSFPYASRMLLPEGVGKSSFAISLISYFVLFSQLGIPTYGIVACSKVREDKEKLSRTVHELLMINLVMSIIVYIIFFILLLSIPKLRSDKLLYMTASITIILNTCGIEWMYKAIEQYTYITIRSVLFKFIALIMMLILIKSQNDYIIYTAITVFATSASQILNILYARKYITVHYMGDYCLKKHFKAVGVFFAMSCATTIYTHLDSVMLGFLQSDVIVGYYSTAIKIRSFLLAAVTSLSAVLLPRSSYYVENKEMEKFYNITSRALKAVFLIGSSVALFFTIFARQSVMILSGDKYEPSILPMRIIMPTVFLVGITNVLGIQMLIPLGKEKIVLKSELAGAIVNIFFNMLLIPGYGAEGAAVGTLFAEFTVLVVQFKNLKKEIISTFLGFSFLNYILILVMAGFLSQLVKGLEFGNIATLISSALIFWGILFICIWKSGILGEIINVHK